MLYGDWSGTSENGYFNGTLTTGSPATIASLNTGTTRFRLGASNASSASSFTTGVVRHLFMGPGTLSDANRQSLEGWIAWDAAMTSVLPAGHPYKNRRP